MLNNTIINGYYAADILRTKLLFNDALLEGYNFYY